MKTTSPPTKNDAVLGRGGGKNNFRKDSLFRKLIEDNWSAYCEIENFRSADKRAFVKEFVVDPILKQDGRFLTFQKKCLKELLPANPQDSKELYKRIAQCLRDEKKKHCPSDKGMKTFKDRLAKSPAAARPSASTKKELTPAPFPTPAKSMSSHQDPRVVTDENPAAMDRQVVFSDEVALKNTYSSAGASMTLTQAMKHAVTANDEASFVSMSDSSSAAAAYPRTVSDSSFQPNNMVSDDDFSVLSEFDSEPLPIDYQCFRSVSDVFSNLLTWSAAASSGQAFDQQQEDDHDHHHVDVDHLPELAPIPLVDAMKVNMNHYPHHNHHMKDVFTGYHPALTFGQDNAGALMEPLCEFDGFPEFCAF